MTACGSRFDVMIGSVLMLLGGGRQKTARTVLAAMGEEIAGDLRWVASSAYVAGYEAGRRELAAEIAGTAKVKRPVRQKSHEWLADKVGDPELRRRVLDLLRISDADLQRVLEGRAQLSSTMWRRLREELDP
jgi:hypothetical protein